MRRLIWSIPAVPAMALLASCAQTPTGAATAGESTPGWTGRTFVVGSNSTIEGDAEATYWAQKWGIGQRR